MYVTTRTRYVENANGHVRKNKMQLQENNVTAQQMTWWLQLRKDSQGWRAHLFCPKDFSSQLGKVLDRTRYPTGVCKGISVSLIGFMLPIQTRVFLC